MWSVTGGAIGGAAPDVRGLVVYARSTTLSASPEMIDSGIAHVRDEVLPALNQIDGCIGLSMLVDRQTGRCIATSAWESEEAMRAAASEVAPIRDRAAAMLGGSPDVAEWEIAVVHRDHNAGDDACARATWLRMDPADIDHGIEVFKVGVLPRMDEMNGFCSASLLVNRTDGRAVSTTTFDSRAALEATRPMADQIRAAASTEARAEVIEVEEFELALAHLHVPEMA